MANAVTDFGFKARIPHKDGIVRVLANFLEEEIALSKYGSSDSSSVPFFLEKPFTSVDRDPIHVHQ